MSNRYYQTFYSDAKRHLVDDEACGGNNLRFHSDWGDMKWMLAR